MARLTRDLAKAQKAAIEPPPAPAPIVANAEAIEAARKEGELAGIAIGIARAQQALAALRADGPAPAGVRAPRVVPGPKVEADPLPGAIPSAGVTGPGQRILDSLAWWEAFGITQPTNEQCAFVASYSATSTGYTNPRAA